MIIYSKQCGVVITTTEHIDSIEVVENDIVAKRRNMNIKIGKYENADKANKVLEKIYNALKDGKKEFEMPESKTKQKALKIKDETKTQNDILPIPNWMKNSK